MKRLEIAQIGLGCLIVFFSFVSTAEAHWAEPPHGMIIDEPNGTPSAIIYVYPPQSPGFAWATTIVGLGVVVCGIFQRKQAAKYASGQIFLGIVSVLPSTILGLVILNQPRISGNIHYLSVVALVSGLFVIVFGFLQFGINFFPTKSMRCNR